MRKQITWFKLFLFVLCFFRISSAFALLPHEIDFEDLQLNFTSPNFQETLDSGDVVQVSWNLNKEVPNIGYKFSLYNAHRYLGELSITSYDKASKQFKWKVPKPGSTIFRGDMGEPLSVEDVYLPVKIVAKIRYPEDSCDSYCPPPYPDMSKSIHGPYFWIRPDNPITKLYQWYKSSEFSKYRKLQDCGLQGPMVCGQPPSNASHLKLGPSLYPNSCILKQLGAVELNSTNCKNKTHIKSLAQINKASAYSAPTTQVAPVVTKKEIAYINLITRDKLPCNCTIYINGRQVLEHMPVMKYPVLANAKVKITVLSNKTGMKTYIDIVFLPNQLVNIVYENENLVAEY